MRSLIGTKPLHAVVTLLLLSLYVSAFSEENVNAGGVKQLPTLDLINPVQFLAAKQFVETKFGRTAIVKNGTGPVAVFLHGFPLNAYQWRHQLSALADIRTCIGIDLMGLGHTEIKPDQDLSFTSQAQMVLETLDALNIDQFDLVGSDTGGGVAQMIVAAAPQRVRSLVLTNADVHDNWPPKALTTVHTAAMQGNLDDLFVSYLDDAEIARDGLGGVVYQNKQHITTELLAAYLEPITSDDDRRNTINRFISSQNNAETVAIKSHLEKFNAPTLILWGTDDVFFGLEWAYWLEETIPGVSKVVEFPGAKLFFAEERYKEVNELLREHWQ